MFFPSASTRNRDTVLPSERHETRNDAVEPAWLGGEAMVAPACLAEWRATMPDAATADTDPDWLPI